MNDTSSSPHPDEPVAVQDSGPRLPVSFVTVDDSAEGQRIDNFLITHLKGVPRTLVYRILRKGEVRVNKGRAKPEQRLQAGDIIRIPPLRLPVRDELPKAGSRFLEELEARILYEDKELLVINKPAGLAVHGGSGVKLGLIESLRQMRPKEKMLELVHRLDRDTSGCIVVAKKRSTLVALHEALRLGTIDKRYTALVFGRWPDRLRDVQAPLLKNQVASGERFVKVSEAGKPARTGFSVIQAYAGYTLVEARPFTGRTHQIRVHARHAGFPLVADDKYSEREANQRARQQGFQRLCLHASRITLTLPASGKPLTVEAPLPADIADPLRQLPKA